MLLQYLTLKKVKGEEIRQDDLAYFVTCHQVGKNMSQLCVKVIRLSQMANMLGQREAIFLCTLLLLCCFNATFAK